MSLSIIYSRTSAGIHAPSVTVETHISNGLPHFSIVGLPETTIKESKDRVRSAIINSGYEFPARRITVNLGPADLPKMGSRFDLPIAIGILIATKQLLVNEATIKNYEFAGELALSGQLRTIPGTLPLAIAAKNAKRCIFLPIENAAEAMIAGEVTVYPAKHIIDICAHLAGGKQLQPAITMPIVQTIKSTPQDFSDIRGQQHAKRALEIAAAGGHSVLLFGPPGTGKSMLATRMATILPELVEDKALEVAAVCSLAKQTKLEGNWKKPPFRSPHHTASSVALVGGGSPPQPGEISLAHHGVLFLDELPEFHRKVLEALREPLETGSVIISRAAQQAEFPAKFQLIAAMNPCPCGYYGDSAGQCRCTTDQIQKYRHRISGPLLDRIDMHIEVARVPAVLLLENNNKAETSAIVLDRVVQAHQQQFYRQQKLNHELSGRLLETHCQIARAEQEMLEQAIKRLRLSARSSHRILKVARTIADLAQVEKIANEHILEALSFRQFDRPVA